MKVLIHGKTVALGDGELLGVGGEADVFRHGDLAVKIYHPIDPSLSAPDRKKAEAVLARKIEKVRAFPRTLPPEVIAPLDVVTDLQDRPIGFTMRAVPNATELMHLGRRSNREGLIGCGQVAALFSRLHAILKAVHQTGVIVGDFNDGNVVFHGAEVRLIDADSMQLPNHLCTVAHERFLDPRLYGRDLTAGPAFDQDTDWYAFTVMLFNSLLYVHPYGGTHPKYPTQLRRAEVGHSVLREDVKYPKAAIHYRVLPDELLAQFERVFDRGRRGIFPESALAMSWTRCRACGTEHARAICPECALKGTFVVRPAIRHQGRCRAVLILRTGGRVLAAAVQGNLKYLHEENGIVRREDGSKVMEEPPQPGMRFAFSGATTWIGYRRDLVAIEREKVRARAVTQQFEAAVSFDASSEGCYRLEQEWLLEDRDGFPTRTGKILEGQTWLRAGEKLGFGFYRAGLTTFWFIFRPGRPGLTDVRLPPLRGRLVDAQAAFDDGHVVFSMIYEQAGRRFGAIYLVDASGAVLGTLEGAAEDHRVLAAARGKCVSGGRILAATEEGIALLEVDRASGMIVERTLFADTEPFVLLGADLLPGPGGSVYVVTTKEICELSLA